MDEWQPPKLGATLRMLVKMRVLCHREFDAPPYAGCSISEAEYEAAGSDGSTEVGYVSWRTRCERYYRIPRGKFDDFERLSSTLWGINNAILSIKAAKLLIQLGEPVSVIATECESIATSCFVVGSQLRRYADVSTHREKSTPVRVSQFADIAVASKARDEIKRQLRSRLPWTAATDRAATTLRSHGIQTTGKTLRNNFADLRPEKAK